MIDITLSPETVCVGETLEVTVRCQPTEFQETNTIVIRPRWRTEGRGDEARGVIRAVRRQPGQVGPSDPFDHTFEFTIPENGPISYEGKLIRIIWEVHVLVDVPWAGDPSHARSFRVLPHGSEASRFPAPESTSATVAS